MVQSRSLHDRKSWEEKRCVSVWWEQVRKYFIIKSAQMSHTHVKMDGMFVHLFSYLHLILANQGPPAYLSTGGNRNPPSSAWWAGNPSPEARPNTAGSQSPRSRPSTSASCRPGGVREPLQLLRDGGAKIQPKRKREERTRNLFQHYF